MIHCGQEIEPIIKPKGPHIGAYCPLCGKWIKWIPKGSSANVLIVDDHDETPVVIPQQRTSTMEAPF